MQNFIMLVVAIGGLYAVKELELLETLRDIGGGRMALQAGGFTAGLMVGPALASAVTGAFSGLAAIATTNLAGFTNIGPRTMLIIGIAFVGLVILSRVRAEDTD